MELQKQIAQITRTYAGSILPHRTRIVSLLGRKCQPEIMYTFLGFELKLGRKRLTCPDISTARYLKIFAEIGMPWIKIPYDPTRTAGLLPDLEKSFYRIKELLLEKGYDRRRHQAALARTYRKLRAALSDCERIQ